MLSLGTSSRAQVAPGYWEVRNRQTSECLTVKDALPYHAADVRVAWCAGGVHQGWRLDPVGDEYYQVRVLHTGMCLDVAYRGTTNGSDVIQGVCQPTWKQTSYNQHWKLVAVDGHFLLVPRHAQGMCLDKDGWGDAIIWTCDANKWWQQWSFS
ncbi:hypothetical protein Cch01nite_44110 [Cellulomonas chitinilytica]|uniref:Ricin B lectin domain-containing protein n=1 Tax=Cellulomonas chitinilytica TaxID=398759 RepID=A0A919P7S0_9CELL|nr:RICIN domain-containing protein [Cellulomonas chitinilytica]GIG23687.1 hypothetical protein Cch01nite_44110 [Cellulomonas chitinilytica]